ncbi:hypothetical protein X777_08417 [Ooceraea biroi]|uniref:Uncharacterized protein n=1 Tax=Ooceraea biroi TaxID=2015173 RepID=A0A026WYT4_OOCBI|nr:hypothetical protein X777_08417 [Ooceraea biroi]
MKSRATQHAYGGSVFQPREKSAVEYDPSVLLAGLVDVRSTHGISQQQQRLAICTCVLVHVVLCT